MSEQRVQLDDSECEFDAEMERSIREYDEKI